MDEVVHSAVLQFMPLEETGELANIGAVIYCPHLRSISYEILKLEEAGRILDFFAPMRPTVLQQALHQAEAALRAAAFDIATTGANEYARRRDLWQKLFDSKIVNCRIVPQRTTVTADGQRVLARLMSTLVRRHIPPGQRPASNMATPSPHSAITSALQTWPPRAADLGEGSDDEASSRERPTRPGT